MYRSHYKRETTHRSFYRNDGDRLFTSARFHDPEQHVSLRKYPIAADTRAGLFAYYNDIDMVAR